MLYDDMTTGANSLKEALEIHKATKEITNYAGFNLRKGRSNCK